MTKARTTTKQRRRAVGAAAAGGLLALGLSVPALASPAAGRALPASAAPTVPASVSGTVTTVLGTMTFSASNVGTSPGKATGNFKVVGDLLPVAIPGAGALNTLAGFTFNGPVTCLDVTGNRFGLIYPIATATGPLGSAFKGQAIYVTGQDNGPGQAQSVGFVGPGPVGSLTSCPALVPFLAVQSGHMTITPAH